MIRLSGRRPAARSYEAAAAAMRSVKAGGWPEIGNAETSRTITALWRPAAWLNLYGPIDWLRLSMAMTDC